MADYSMTEEYFYSVKSGGVQMPSMHYHNSYELYYLEAGNREYFVEDAFFSVHAGEFVLIPPERLHRTGGEYGVRILVGFTEAFLRSAFTEEAIPKLLACFSATRLIPDPIQRESLHALLKKLGACEDRTDFAVVLGLLLRELAECKSGEVYQDRVSQIMHYINENYDEIGQIEQISEHFFISKYYLCRIFKNAMQMTVVDYLNRLRVKNACVFLKSTTMRVAEISARCGFNSTAYFSNVFKKITGMSPAEFRRKQC